MLILFSGKVSVLILVLDDCYRCRAPLYRAASNVKNGHNTSDKHVLLPPPRQIHIIIAMEWPSFSNFTKPLLECHPVHYSRGVVLTNHV